MNNSYIKFSSTLLSRPSAIEGISKIFDMGNTFQKYKTYESGEVADRVALENDWLAIGNDMNMAINTYGQKV